MKKKRVTVLGDTRRACVITVSGGEYRRGAARPAAVVAKDSNENKTRASPGNVVVVGSTFRPFAVRNRSARVRFPCRPRERRLWELKIKNPSSRRAARETKQ